jgi:hypothetical protein
MLAAIERLRIMLHIIVERYPDPVASLENDA